MRKSASVEVRSEGVSRRGPAVTGRRRRRKANVAQVRRLARQEDRSTWVTISHVRLLDG